MGTNGFQHLFRALAQLPLSADEIECLRDWLGTLQMPGRCLALIEQAKGRCACPHCGNARCHRSGHANGLQRYRCVVCLHSFNALTGTPLARLRQRDKWLAYFQCLIESRTVRAAAERVAVAKSTSFRWRHRFVAAVRREEPPTLKGIVETDETYVLESQKGSRHLDRPVRKRGGRATCRGISKQHECVLVARDRGDTTHAFHAGQGEADAGRLLHYLKPVLARDALLVSDGAAAYPAFAKLAGISHRAINVRAGEYVRGAIHVNGVNGWHGRFKTWLRRFCGVASRYLANYAGWQMVLDAAALIIPEHWLRAAVAPRQQERP
ncbi:transposase-like protein [Pseudoduganella flava]|uniref:IS1595 family transposase n=1 Tax=Pseudoduganella flava TaxID=871742 RepID=A0A562Q3X1_9BURK|nr:IS1595 family transposase [Pseudoduganella flava]QGZ41473.1 IS1595 family transposase [Pseudoduganella flava]TWI51432.1 transposase-like protein [Pseudoduganella flava]